MSSPALSVGRQCCICQALGQAWVPAGRAHSRCWAAQIRPERQGGIRGRACGLQELRIKDRLGDDSPMHELQRGLTRSVPARGFGGRRFEWEEDIVAVELELADTRLDVVECAGNNRSGRERIRVGRWTDRWEDSVFRDSCSCRRMEGYHRLQISCLLVSCTTSLKPGLPPSPSSHLSAVNTRYFSEHRRSRHT